MTQGLLKYQVQNAISQAATHQALPLFVRGGTPFALLTGSLEVEVGLMEAGSTWLSYSLPPRNWSGIRLSQNRFKFKFNLNPERFKFSHKDA